MRLRLDVGSGRQLAPKAQAGTTPTVEAVSFQPPFPPAITAQLLMPAGLRDESGRTLANARRFPLEVDIAEAPPLVKFAAPFGVLEAREGGVLPVTIRNVEARLRGNIAAIAGAKARINPDDDATIADWLRRVAKSQEVDLREEKRGSTAVTVNHTGDRPLLNGSGGAPVKLQLPAGGRRMEVVGIPLEKPGFYVVELASPRLGRALLGRAATRYVAASALVTNMAVHFKWGRGSSLAWVTALDSGKPVAGALVSVSDSCSGRKLASGQTDSVGRLSLRNLPGPSTAEGCEIGGTESPPLLVSYGR
jgi:hypothetical protein